MGHARRVDLEESILIATTNEEYRRREKYCRERVTASWRPGRGKNINLRSRHLFVAFTAKKHAYPV